MSGLIAFDRLDCLRTKDPVDWARPELQLGEPLQGVGDAQVQALAARRAMQRAATRRRLRWTFRSVRGSVFSELAIAARTLASLATMIDQHRAAMKREEARHLDTKLESRSGAPLLTEQPTAKLEAA